MIRARQDCGVVVIEPGWGPLDDELVDGLLRMVAGVSGSQPIVVDLSESLLVDNAAARRLVNAASTLACSGQPMSLTRRGRGGANELVSFGASRVAVFGSVGDALQAHRMRQAGYGPGWQPIECIRVDTGAAVA